MLVESELKEGYLRGLQSGQCIQRGHCSIKKEGGTDWGAMGNKVSDVDSDGTEGGLLGCNIQESPKSGEKKFH